MSGSPKSADERLRETIAADRLARSRLPPVSAADLERLSAEARARAGTSPATSGVASAAAALPLAARVALTPSRVVNPKIQDADVGKYRAPKFKGAPWWDRAKAAVAERAKGDPLELTLLNFCHAIGRRFAWGNGSARLSLEALAKAMGCCVETARKTVRYFQRFDVLNVFNTLRRDENNLLVRAPNLYLAPREEHAPIEVPENLSPELSQLARVGAELARWVSYFGGMLVRDWGLNATPQAPRPGPPPPS